MKYKRYCKNLSSLSYKPKEQHIPLSQKIAIHSIKYFPKVLTHTVLNTVTNYCSKWKNTKDSKKDIISFIKQYNINWKESKKCKNINTIEKCASKFNTKNDFFQRERTGIKIQSQRDTRSIVSPADCRLVMYNHISSSTKYWIKGKEFTLDKLLGNNNIYNFKKIAICRLAPDDYHRFHFPIHCIYMGFYRIKGQYYSVDPRIVNSSIDVLGENKREVHMLYNPVIGNVCCVIIGATCTGSIEMEKLKEGEIYKKGELFGKFGFGGSTIVMLFEKHVTLCDNIIKNSKKHVETYIRVGTFLGK